MCLESEEKYGDEATSNHVTNTKLYTTNIEKFIVCRSCAKEEDLQIRSEE